MFWEIVNKVILGTVYCVGYIVGFFENLVRLINDLCEE